MFTIEGTVEGVYAKPRKDGKGATCRIGVTTVGLTGSVQNEFGFAFDLTAVVANEDPHDVGSHATKDGETVVKVGQKVRVEAYHSDKYGPVFSDLKNGQPSARITVLPDEPVED